MVVVSHAYKFVFIKTSKTGGTAIETCLSNILPETDILSPIFPKENGHKARNYQNDKGIFYNHMSAREVIKILGNSAKDYFFWCVEREPIDKCLSSYAMLKNSPDHNKGNESLTWDNFLEKGNFPINTNQYFSRPRKLSLNKKILVKQILDYKNIRNTLPIFLKDKFGIEGFNLNKSNAKGNYRTSYIPKIDEVNKEQKEMIYKRFRISNRILKEFGIHYDKKYYNHS